MRWSPRIGWRALFQDLYREWSDDLIDTTAAALTYYGVLSLFPFLLFLVTIGGLVLDPVAIERLLVELERVAPVQVVEIVGERLTALHKASGGGLLTVGFVGALWAASGAAAELTLGLNRCYEVRETRPWLKRRLLAVGVTLVAGIAGVLVAVVFFAMPLLARFLPEPLGSWATLLRFPVAGLLLMALWEFLYYILPNVRPRFQLISVGSAIGVILWLAASWGFTVYVRNFGKYEATYGTLGGVIVLLIWMWMSSMAVLLGAGINKVLTKRHDQAAREEANVEVRPGEPQPA